MRPLVEALSRWKGRQYVEKTIEERGFFLHRAYQERVRIECQRDNFDDSQTLCRFWDEAAKERVSSAGAVETSLRTFFGETAYRSSYLDELATKFDFEHSQFRNPPLHPCLYRRLVESRRPNGSRGAHMLSWVEKVKRDEAKGFNLSRSENWKGLKSDLEGVFGRSAAGFGFQFGIVPKHFLGDARKAFFKQVDHGLLFYTWYDAGGLPQVMEVPIQFRIKHIEDDLRPFGLGDFRGVVPGYELYARCIGEPVENYVLGVHALLELFDVFAGSFL